MIQSLYACTHSSASSLSWRSRNAWPQKRGRMLGKHMDASVWFAAMSFRRSDWIHAPGRMSSKVTGVTSSVSKPTAAESLGNG